MKAQKLVREAPFRKKDLLPISQFVKFCNKKGVSISLKQLKFYEQLGLLKPPIGIYSEVGTYNRILLEKDGQDQWFFIPSSIMDDFKPKDVDASLYYKYGGLSYGSDELISYYFDNNLICYPSQESFSSKYYEITSPEEFNFSSFPLESKVTLMYSKYQIFPLKLLVNKFAVRLTYEQLCYDAHHLDNINTKLVQHFEGFIPYLSREINNYYKIFELYFEILNLYDEALDIAIGVFNASRSMGLSNKEATTDFYASLKSSIHVFHPQVLTVINALNYSVLDLVSFQSLFISLGSKLDQTRDWYMYMEHVPLNALNKSEGDYGYIRESYTIAEVFGWAVGVLGGKPLTLKKVLANIDDLSSCLYCHDLFRPNRVTQKTCGKDRCEKDNKNELKRNKRKENRLLIS